MTLAMASLLTISVLAMAMAMAMPLLCLAHGGDHHTHDDLHSSPSPSPYPAPSEPTLRSEDLILTKVYCLIIVFFATFFAGISPCFVKWSNGLLVLGTQFAGGVFLGTATMHFLSDSNETFQDKTTKEYPFAFMLACAGYLLTMLGDCVIQWIFDKESKYTLPSKVDTEKGKMLI